MPMKKTIKKPAACMIRATLDKPAEFSFGDIIPAHSIYGYVTVTLHTHAYRVYFVVNPDKISLAPERMGKGSILLTTAGMDEWYRVTSFYVQDEKTQAFAWAVRNYVLDTLRHKPAVLDKVRGKVHHTITDRDLACSAPKDRLARMNETYRMKPDHAESALTQRTDFKEVTTEAHWAFRGAASVRANAARYE